MLRPTSNLEEGGISERHVKLFQSGRNQAVRIPREFELPGEDAIMRREGERLIMEPAPPKSLLALLAFRSWRPRTRLMARFGPS